MGVPVCLLCYSCPWWPIQNTLCYLLLFLLSLPAIFASFDEPPTTLILCAVGYLIYWIMSIRSREMMFGVLRASGMHKGEMFYMLINEQIFSGVFAILGGVGIGHLSSRMFVPILQTAYAASNQVLPMELITRQSDMLRLYGVVAGVMALCLAVLIFIVFRMNVAKALKLGEE